MGQGTSQLPNGGALSPKSDVKNKQRQIIDVQELRTQDAMRRVEDEIPRLKEIFAVISRYEGQRQQIERFSDLLYQSLPVNKNSGDTFKVFEQRSNLASVLFQCFIKKGQSLKLDQLIRLYAAIKYEECEDHLEILFRVVANNPPAFDQELQEYYVFAADLQRAAIKNIGILTEEAVQFANMVGIFENRKIYKPEFFDMVRQYRRNCIFSWVQKFNREYKGLENAQEHTFQGLQLPKLSIAASVTEDFTQEEYNTLNNFFEENIATQSDIQEATTKFKKLFSDRSIHIKFCNRIIESFLFASNSNFYDKKVYFDNMRILFKEKDDIKIYEFIFDIFSKYSQDRKINSTQIEEVILVFGRAINPETPNSEEEQFFMQVKAIGEMEKSKFVEMASLYIDYRPQFERIKTILYSELRVRPVSGRQEYDIIKQILGQQHLDLEKFILENMNKNDYFFAINKKFFDQWLEYAKSGFNIKDPQSKIKIDNQSLFTTVKDQRKIVSLRRNENVVVLPPRIWSAFVGWYGEESRNFIKAYVIEYPNTPENTLNQSKNNLRKSSPNGQMIVELELDFITIRGGLLDEQGKEPSKYNLIYITPKITLLDLKAKICNSFQIRDIERTQLWMNDQLIQEEILLSLVENNKEIKEGMKFFVEQMLENSQWPSSQRIQATQSKNSYLEFKTVGCYNQGNTCYINSVVQCVANSPFFKEFFLKDQLYQKRDIIMTDEKFSHLRPMFLMDRDISWKNQVNVKNPMAFEGQIVKAFAKLVEDLFTSNYACYNEPKKLKAIIGKHFEQFEGKDQQDAQEFLVILLDSLQEELNIRQKKPYIEKPISEGRNQDELSFECWSNFLHRNWSFIAFLFFGQMKSHLRCMQCGIERDSFDEYSTLSLPLPESSFIKFKIVLYLLPEEIKSILSKFEDGFDRISLLEPSTEDLTLARSRISLKFDTQERNLQALIKERPIILSIQMMPTQQVWEITDYLTKTFPDLDIFKTSGKTQMEKEHTEIVYYLMAINDEKIHIVIPPEIYLNQIQEGTQIMATEVLTAKGKHQIQEFQKEQTHGVKGKNFLLNFKKPIRAPSDFLNLTTTAGENEKQDPVEFTPVVVDTTTSADSSQKPQVEIVCTTGQRTSEEEFFESQRIRKVDEIVKVDNISPRVKIETTYFDYCKYQLQKPVNNYYKTYHEYFSKTQYQGNRQQGLRPINAKVRDEEDFIEYCPPQEILVYAINRKILQKELYFTVSGKYHAKVFGKPIFLFANHETTGRELYEELWMRSRYLLNFTHMKYFQDPMNLWWNCLEVDEIRAKALQHQTQYAPFVLKFVRNISSDMQTCSYCQNDKCFGCIIDPNNKLSLFEVLQENSFIAIDWNIEFLQQYFQQQSLTPNQHEDLKTVKSEQQPQQKVVHLTECFKMFQSAEEIFAKEGIRCETCKVATNHTKKMGVARAPPILVIHLKRFKIINHTKKKIDQYVHYPLYDFDMSPFLTQQTDQPQLYDLYAVVNHFGGINSGHYICYVKNERTKNWYQYDDSYVKQVVESKVHSEFAYILFYRRKDIVEKPLDKIFPSITLEDGKWFRGMPVKIKRQFGSKLLGYLWDKRPSENRDPSKDIYHVKIGHLDFFTTLSMLDFEDDSDNLQNILSRDSVIKRQSDIESENNFKFNDDAQNNNGQESGGDGPVRTRESGTNSHELKKKQKLTIDEQKKIDKEMKRAKKEEERMKEQTKKEVKRLQKEMKALTGAGDKQKSKQMCSQQ